MSAVESGAALGRCTGLNLSTFATSYWSQQPLLSHHSPGFADLLSADDVDELVAERGIRSPFFRMVKAGQSVGGTTRSANAGNRRIDDLVEADVVREQYASGATLVLQSLHRIHPPLVRFCSQLADELGHPTQCNAYVTPPGSQGFAPHHDTHDVFVLQVDGSKRWNVYDPVLQSPLSSQPSQRLTGEQPLIPEGAEPLLSVVLAPGDALYLPRGYVHSAQTSADRSIHLTIGALAVTAYDVLREVITLAADEPAFRRSLPLGRTDDVLAPVPDIVAEAAQWLSALPAERLREAARTRATASPEPLGMLAAGAALRSLNKETVVRPRAGLQPSLSQEAAADRVALRLPDREISMPAFTGPALRALLAGPCRVGELDLPVDDALVLVRRLLREGALTSA